MEDKPENPQATASASRSDRPPLSKYAAKRHTRLTSPVAGLTNGHSTAISWSVDDFVQHCAAEAKLIHYDQYTGHLRTHVVNELNVAITAPSTLHLLQSSNVSGQKFVNHVMDILIARALEREGDILHADFDFMLRREHNGAPLKLQAKVRDSVSTFAYNYFNTNWPKVAVAPQASRTP